MIAFDTEFVDLTEKHTWESFKSAFMETVSAESLDLSADSILHACEMIGIVYFPGDYSGDYLKLQAEFNSYSGDGIATITRYARQYCFE